MKSYLRITLLCVIFFAFSANLFSQTNVFDIARSGTVEDLKTLIKSDPNCINLINESGNSTLILACYKGNNEVAEYLIRNVKDINFISGMGTALMAATVKNNANLVKLLLENNANPNLTDANGTTALIYATIFKSYEIAELLIKYKADDNKKDNNGKSAIDYAFMANDDKLIQILKTK